mmetsp:Transcript_14826/g.22208  ORF Transcript_14826/g.22208 Transcript_14826/m.22208 type:complete len:599 (-) Transcript_14826:47-1843(-)
MLPDWCGPCVECTPEECGQNETREGLSKCAPCEPCPCLNDPNAVPDGEFDVPCETCPAGSERKDGCDPNELETCESYDRCLGCTPCVKPDCTGPGLVNYEDACIKTCKECTEEETCQECVNKNGKYFRVDPNDSCKCDECPFDTCSAPYVLDTAAHNACDDPCPCTCPYDGVESRPAPPFCNAQTKTQWDQESCRCYACGENDSVPPAFDVCSSQNHSSGDLGACPQSGVCPVDTECVSGDGFTVCDEDTHDLSADGCTCSPCDDGCCFGEQECGECKQNKDITGCGTLTDQDCECIIKSADECDSNFPEYDAESCCCSDCVGNPEKEYALCDAPDTQSCASALEGCDGCTLDSLRLCDYDGSDSTAPERVILPHKCGCEPTSCPALVLAALEAECLENEGYVFEVIDGCNTDCKCGLDYSTAESCNEKSVYFDDDECRCLECTDESPNAPPEFIACSGNGHYKNLVDATVDLCSDLDLTGYDVCEPLNVCANARDTTPWTTESVYCDLDTHVVSTDGCRCEPCTTSSTGCCFELHDCSESGCNFYNSITEGCGSLDEPDCACDLTSEVCEGTDKPVFDSNTCCCLDCFSTDPPTDKK